MHWPKVYQLIQTDICIISRFRMFVTIIYFLMNHRNISISPVARGFFHSNLEKVCKWLKIGIELVQGIQN